MNRSSEFLVFWAATGLVLMGLSACGGGTATQTSTSEQSEDDVVLDKPSLGLSARMLAGTSNNVQVTITPSSSNSSNGATYCVRTNRLEPAAGDACFKAETIQGVMARGKSPVSIWVNNAGSVKLAGTLVVPACSQGAYDASAVSVLKTVCLMTDKGELVLALENVKAPQSVANFLRYVNEGFYNGTYFHRVSSSFVVQGGGFVFDGTQYNKKNATYDPIRLEKTTETTLSNIQYSVAMARTGIENSATTEFFINTVNNASSLNATSSSGGYAVFGQTIFGQTTTLNDIKGVSVTSSTILSGENSQPVTPLALQWAYQIQ